MSLKKWTRAGALVALLAGGGWGASYAFAPAYEGTAGITYGKAYAPVRKEQIDFHLWYPAEAGGRRVTVGGNGVFFGTPAGRNAPVAKGTFPLIVMSHGSGGNAGQFGWIASTLASEGYVVALPNHPGSTSGNASAAKAVKLWTRPPDMSAVIDAILSDRETYSFVDPDRIGTVGFSSGGYTAMAISGARVDATLLQQFCDGDATGMSDCEFFRRAGIDLHQIDLSPAAQNHADPRIKAAVIVDPGVVSTLTPQSLGQIDIPMLIVNLGKLGAIPPGVDAGPIIEQIPQASYQTVPDAIHFSFLAECKAKGAKILEREGELDPLCEDAGGRPRAQLHDDFRKRIVGFLSERL